jgi:CheY-like chemotaxis protein
MKQKKQVCIIDDDPIQIFLIKKLIELTCCVKEIIAYKDGKEAFEGLKERHGKGCKCPDLIFLDINMPIWDGWEFLKEFKELNIYLDSEIYILTSSLSIEDFEKATFYGLQNNYLSKPLDKEKLNQIVSG